MSKNEDCIFCKIVAGEVPSYSVYEDKDCLGILDIHPASKGHTVLIAKGHYETIDELPDDTFSSVMLASKTIARHLKETYELDRVAQAVIGLDVPHAHVNIIPIFVGNEIKVTQDFESEPDHTKLSVIANKLKIGDLAAQE